MDVDAVDAVGGDDAYAVVDTIGLVGSVDGYTLVSQWTQRLVV